MQNRIDKLFLEKKGNILSIFLTAGYPKLNDTMRIIKALEKTDVDLIEIGIPFSDPVADGPVIQRSSQTALENGMNLKLLFEQLKELRTETQMSILLMGYLNSVMQFGMEDFYKQCSQVGIDGLILPDLSLNEYLDNHKKLAEQYNINVVFLISPATKPERIKLIDNHSKGFVYLVSSNATTGTANGITNETINSIKKIKELNLINPMVMGFGIRGQKEFNEACTSVNGAIIGTAFIELLSQSADFENTIPDFISNIKQKTKL